MYHHLCTSVCPSVFVIVVVFLQGRNLYQREIWILGKDGGNNKQKRRKQKKGTKGIILHHVKRKIRKQCNQRFCMKRFLYVLNLGSKDDKEIQISITY